MKTVTRKRGLFLIVMECSGLGKIKSYINSVVQFEQRFEQGKERNLYLMKL